MDATGSMKNLIEGTKQTIKTMFDRADAVLIEHGFKHDFQLQIGAYRNYGDG